MCDIEGLLLSKHAGFSRMWPWCRIELALSAERPVWRHDGLCDISVLRLCRFAMSDSLSKEEKRGLQLYSREHHYDSNGQHVVGIITKLRDTVYYYYGVVLDQ